MKLRLQPEDAQRLRDGAAKHALNVSAYVARILDDPRRQSIDRFALLLMGSRVSMPSS